jgi:DNA-binding transcriptional MerR regulator
MEYGIKELSQLAGVSTRTLRYYDEIGLLKPSRVTEAGYRYYGSHEVTLLQQILFYRERGFELKTIQRVLQDKDFDMLEAMEEHLRALEAQRAEMEALIATVKKTIRNMKGDCAMSDKEKFEALKERAIRENEEKYGHEARQKYGNESVDGANCNMMGLTEERFARWQALDEEILRKLEEGVVKGISADGDEAKQIALLHKQWLLFTLPNYTAPMHRGIAVMYIADERFTAYYDRNVPGCAQLLHDAVQNWI